MHKIQGETSKNAEMDAKNHKSSDRMKRDPYNPPSTNHVPMIQ